MSLAVGQSNWLSLNCLLVWRTVVEQLPHHSKVKDSSTATAVVTGALYYNTYYGRNLPIFVISLSVCPWQASPA
jgi:hypothetical protein